VVFYDGTNDLSALAEQGGEQPTIYNADVYRATIEGGVHDADDLPADRSLPGAVYDWWRVRSLVGEVAGSVRQAVAAPAGAQEVLSRESREAAVPAAVDVYTRARSRALDLVERHDVAAVFFWQPEWESSDETSPSRAAGRAVGPPTIDLSEALLDVDPEDVYIDGGHTNELGARLVAEAMWPDVVA
ncbi:hypothetical protein B7486_75875, partial [cyanobacterium TDX16]